jgi:hypothetical protein
MSLTQRVAATVGARVPGYVQMTNPPPTVNLIIIDRKRKAHRTDHVPLLIVSPYVNAPSYRGRHLQLLSIRSSVYSGAMEEKGETKDCNEEESCQYDDERSAQRLHSVSFYSKLVTGPLDTGPLQAVHLLV